MDPHYKSIRRGTDMVSVKKAYSILDGAEDILRTNKKIGVFGLIMVESRLYD